MDDYLSKPLRLADLVELVEALGSQSPSVEHRRR
jgi:DNA-binding response OmpR family regulator